MPKCDLKTRYIPATFAWVLLLSTTILFFVYPCQYYLRSYPWVPAYQGVITFFVLANFSLATFMDPGVIPKASPDEDREEELRAPLYKNAEINGITVKMKWCVTCKFYRPPRCSHCSVCNHCIETFDHHCPWVNNCIGRRNYRFFFFFLVSLSIHMLSIFSLCLFYVLKVMPDIKQPSPIVAMVLMGLVTVLAIPIFGLTVFHMVLVSRGRTTNEQVTGKFKGGYNPFSRGCWHNCCYTQFGPQYPSLLKPEKYAARRSHKENQSISVITTNRDANNARGSGGGAAGAGGMHGNNIVVNSQQHSPRGMPQQNTYYDTRDNRHTQVKTYTDQGNGYNQRSGSTTLYSKLSPGRECSDTDIEPPTASQSQDCEPTPPLQRHNSSNFYLPTLENGGINNGGVVVGGGGGGDSPRHLRMYHPRHSPLSRQRGLEPQRVYQADALSPDHPAAAYVNNTQSLAAQSRSATTATPTMQQRIKPLGVATPLVMASPVRRSNPGTPTQPRRPDFIGIINQQQLPPPPTHTYYDFTSGLPPQHPQMPSIQQQQQQLLLQQQRAILQHHQQQQQQSGVIVQYQGQQQQQQQQQSLTQTYSGSPQRRFLSEGELVRQGDNELSYARSNNTVDNIRELAGSPQRGVYMWKDNSPGFNTGASNSVGIAGVQLPLNVVGSSSAGGTIPSSMHHAQYITVSGAASQASHPLIMTHSRVQDYAQQQQYHRSNPTSPTTMLTPPPPNSAGYMLRYGNTVPASSSTSSQPQALGNYVQTSSSGSGGSYQPALRGGVPVFPPNPNALMGANSLQSQSSPQIKRKQTPTRPMSFVRALEMTDSMEMQSLEQQQQQHQQTRNNGGLACATAPGGGGVGSVANSISAAQNAGHSGTATPDRASVYDMNYEISV